MKKHQIEFKNYKMEHLKETVRDMTHISIIQVQKSKQALFKSDLDLALEVLSNWKRVKILKLKIDYDCKNFLALYNPVAVDLRLILSSLKISESLERIANHAEKICRVLKKNNAAFEVQMLRDFNIHIMFDTAIQMLHSMQEAMESESSAQAGETFKKDLHLNRFNREANDIAASFIIAEPNKTELILSILDIVHKLERIGDEAKNISERLIFYYEAKVLRHTSFYKGKEEE